MSLHEVVQETATLRRLIYRLVSQGKLRSREGANGEIEIWIEHDDRLAADRGAVPGHQSAVLIEPLVASCERDIQFAYENGVLSERAATLRRELQALRDATVGDKQALERSRKRLEALEDANASLTRMLLAGSDDQTSGPRVRRAWFVLVGVLLLVTLAWAAINLGLARVPALPTL